MQVSKEASPQLLKFCGQIIEKCVSDKGQKKSNEDMLDLASKLMEDLNDTFHRLTYENIQKAFHQGARLEDDRMAIIPQTWIAWIKIYKAKLGVQSNKDFQEKQAIQIEYNSANTDRSADHKEYVLNVVVAKYEEWLNFKEPQSRFGNPFKLSGVKMQYEWFETNGFINITPEDAATLRRKVRGSIKHENGSSTTLKYKIDNACREHLINELYAELKEGKVNLREQALEILNE